MASASAERLPASHGLVSRPALFDRLSRAGPGGVTVVCAPAGSGKTVLLRSWVASEDRVAWVSVERGERDGPRFWLSVIDELASAVGDGVVERVAATPVLDGQAVVEHLLSDLRGLEQPLVLVIDDLHELRSAEALGWLEYFLAGLPPQLQVVLATREEPSVALHRLRLAGGLAELRPSDLRFSLEETRELIDRSGITLSDRGVALLHERTEGWAAGLRLAAISLADHPEPERFVAEFSGSERTVSGYLLAEVLERQPPEVRDLLLRTSVVERVSGALGDALTGGAGSEAILQRLEDANAFVTSLDVGRTWFRYHHLLADLLRLELRRSSPALVDSLHRAAAEWFAAEGQAVEAIGHAQAARDWGHAARLLSDNYVDLVFNGRKGTLRALLATFPADAPEADAELALAFATGRLYDGLLDESAAHIAVAQRAAATVPEQRRRRFDLRSASAELWLASQRGDLTAAREAMRSVDARAAGMSERARADDHRASALMNFGIAELWSLHVEDARRDLEEALTLARRIERPYLEIGCLGHLAWAAILSGWTIPLALQSSEEAVSIAAANGWGTHRIVAPAAAAGAAALAWLGRIGEAERWLDRVELRESPAEELEVEPVLHCARAFVRLGQGRYEEALGEFRAAEAEQRLLAREHALTVEVRAWILHTQVLMGATAPVREALAGLDPDVRDGAGCGSPPRLSPSRTATRRMPSTCWRRCSKTSGSESSTAARRCSTCAGPRSTPCCSTPSRGTSSTTRPAASCRSSARSSWPRWTGRSCSSCSYRSASSSRAIPGTGRPTRRCSRRSSTCSAGPRRRAGVGRRGSRRRSARPSCGSCGSCPATSRRRRSPRSSSSPRTRSVRTSVTSTRSSTRTAAARPWRAPGSSGCSRRAATRAEATASARVAVLMRARSARPRP